MVDIARTAGKTFLLKVAAGRSGSMTNSLFPMAPIGFVRMTRSASVNSSLL
jgi:hypothetical protein